MCVREMARDFKRSRSAVVTRPPGVLLNPRRSLVGLVQHTKIRPKRAG